MAKTFRENLRDELNYQDMKVKELSAATGIPKPTLDCYLSARQVIPPADIAVKIAGALNTSVEFLVTGEDEKIVPREFAAFEKFRELLTDFARLSQDSAEKLKIMIHALAETESKMH
jgi:transcriptional regulator with XRE-family HTH domain